MALWTDLIKPADSTGFAREVVDNYEANNATLSPIFPAERVNDTIYEWSVNRKHQDLAAFRAFNAESKIIGGGDFEEKTAKLIPLSAKQPFKEYDKIRRMGQNSPETVREAFDRLTTEVAESMVRRIVLARGEALATGKLAIREEGMVQNVDFERRADFTTTLGTFWSTDGADPIADLEALRDKYVAENGGQAPQIITSSKVVASLVRSTGLRAYLGTNAPAMLTRAAVNEILQSYGFPALTIFDDQVTYQNPATGQRVVQRVLPQDSIIFAAPGAGATVWGVTAEADDPRYNLSGDLPGLVVGAYATDDPATKWIHANASVLPALVNANATLVAKVLA